MIVLIRVRVVNGEKCYGLWIIALQEQACELAGISGQLVNASHFGLTDESAHL